MKPFEDAFTRKEWRIVRAHRTPHQVQQFLNGLLYYEGKGTWATGYPR